MGVASFQGCPPVFGRVVRLNAATGAIQAALNFSSLVPAKCRELGAWSSPAVDPAENSIFIGTSNDFCSSRFQDAILEAGPFDAAHHLTVAGSPVTAPGGFRFRRNSHAFQRNHRRCDAPARWRGEQERRLLRVGSRQSRSRARVDVRRSDNEDDRQSGVRERGPHLLFRLGRDGVTRHGGRSEHQRVRLATARSLRSTRPPGSRSGRFSCRGASKVRSRRCQGSSPWEPALRSNSSRALQGRYFSLTRNRPSRCRRVSTSAHRPASSGHPRPLSATRFTLRTRTVPSGRSRCRSFRDITSALSAVDGDRQR